MSKYKYYFRKPKSEIVKDVLSWLVIAGVVSIAATSPCFIHNLIKSFKKGRKYPRKRIYDTLYKLRRQRCIITEKKDHQIYIRLTERGKRKAG